MNFEKAKKIIMNELQRRNFHVEEDKNGITFSLTNIGLSCVYAIVDNEEIQHFADNNDEEEDEAETVTIKASELARGMGISFTKL